MKWQVSENKGVSSISEDKEYLRQEIIDAEDIKRLRKSKGWKLVETNLLVNLKSLGDQLMRAENLIEINRMQGQMKMVNHIFSFLDTTIEKGDEAKKLIEEDSNDTQG